MEGEEPKIDIQTKDPDVINSANNLKEDDKDKETNAGEDNKNKEENFAYLEARDSEEPSVFEFAPSEKKDINDAENKFKPKDSNPEYVICILLKEDSEEDSVLLKSTLYEIRENFDELEKLGINYENILIYIFVNKIKKNELVSQEVIKNKLKGENQFLLSHMKLKNDGRDIKIEVVSKGNYMSDIQSLKIFYCLIVKSFKKEKILITSVITAGVSPTNNALSNLIQSCFIYDNKDKPKSYDCVSVPALEINENKKNESIFEKIIKYERVHFNIYNMNYYYSTGVVPVLSLMNTMIIDKELMRLLSGFYSQIDIMDENEMPKIDYHDYNLSLYLYQNKIPIKYLSKQSFGKIIYRDFDYQNIWVSRYSGYYSNFFEILKTFINFELPIFHKVFTLFQIIGMIIEFIYPGLSILVIYSIFVEAFDIEDRYPAWFMTMLYIIMYLGSGVASLISYKSKDISTTSLIYYYFMEIYYLFILVCSVPAMDNIKKKKLFGDKYKDVEVEGFYKFNTAAITCLIIFTFIIAILPMIFRIGMITENIISMLLYLVLGAPMSTSNLLIAKIWNAPRAPGGKTIDERKGLTILFFFLFNLFFGFLSAYIYDRKLRANCVMGLAIFYLIYLFFKIVGIVISMMGSPDLTQKSSIKNILKGEYNFESKNSSDHINEEKLDNDNENENNEDNKEENNNGENDENENQKDDDNEEDNNDNN